MARAMLAVDAWVNASLYESGRKARARYDAFSAFMDRFHVSGPTRGVVALACEGLTLGFFGAMLMLALAIPAFRETSDDWLKKQELAVTFLDRYGVEVGRRGIRHDDSIPLDALPDHLIKAVLATEDRRFYEHFGIDVIGTLRAVTVNARSSGVVQGGSSITQQLAKNLFLSNERTLERKVKEAFLALWLEFHLSKKEILKLYLDRAYMGGGAFGVQAAAEFYFGKSARDLTLAESAMLAGLFKAPTRYAPHINLPAARGRANVVLDNMVQAGFMSEGQIYAARRNPATAVDRKQEASPDWYLDWAFQEIKQLAERRKLGDDRVLTVRTALDMGVEQRAQQAIEDNLRQYGPQYQAKQSATVVIETATGAVRAIVGGRDYGASQFNRAVDALRQPGSSFKPYVYLAALMSGKFRPSTIVVDSPVCIGNWCPKNYGGSYGGSVPLAVALAKSYNTVAVKLTTAVGDGNPRAGRARVVETARRMGVTAPLNDTVSLPIGAAEVTLLEHSAAYAVFGNGGRRVEPHAAIEIRNSRGDVIWRHDRDGAQPQQAFPPGVIAEMNSMLVKVVEEGTARRAILGPDIKVGGKTGTTNGYKDAWFCGFTGNYTGCVWYGNDDDSPMNNMTGGTLPAQTWRDIMAYAHQGVELRPLPGAPVDPTKTPSIATLSGPGGARIVEITAQRPTTLSRRSAEALAEIESTMREATKPTDASPKTGPQGRSGFLDPARRAPRGGEAPGRITRLSDGSVTVAAEGGGVIRIDGGTLTNVR
ncbi:MAG: penicillin-binding protein 1A [Methylobacteriaceae bacterium]|nr:penicillin-binding protein 1A [Methylobacteriaceae bacterium]